ncbi:DNA repair protein RecN [Ruminococcus sp. Marseille-P6503]|uniref:DNA repair protein RecN n=1 Tax=Ruminococcus sp. Marseille-P6503 TaxID=2364796 RepID=UPI000F53BC40|nr:DNA repair protein RecN [Ruminococcus sp. Marseille-P6503]
MLKELYIENLAVIEKAAIEFNGSFNVFTGETGAGKSILINGINAILGQRVTKDIVRTGADKAVVSGMFTDMDISVLAKLNDLGIQLDDGQLFLSREISSDGGSVARINSRSVNVSVLREIGALLVNIHGQHDNQVLMAPEEHIHILDSYADDGQLLSDYKKSFKELQELARRINRIKISAGKKTERIEELKAIIGEIESLNLDPEEDERIEDELEIAKNAVVLSEAVYSAGLLLSGSDEVSGAAEIIAEAAGNIAAYTDILADLEPLASRLSSARIEISDVAGELSSLLGSLDVDPKRYDFLNQRNDELRKVKKKYGPELDDVVNTLENSRNELDLLLGEEQDLSQLMSQQKELLACATKKAKALSDFRKSAAERFVREVTGELEFLNMPKVKLVVDQKPGKLTVNGMDTIEFLISANVGEEPKPIAKIASGGELSRIMLALKNVIADRDSIETLIFDEIDTGVSGRAAQKIGLKLRQISKIRQVLCVTHLSQIAVMADNHLLIEKEVRGERTVTTVKRLDFEQRKHEIARILGGDNITRLTLENAEELLRSVNRT